MEKPDAAALARFDCVYAGDEFCQAKLPSPAALQRLRAAYKGRIVLSSPVLTDECLAKFKRLSSLINSWGSRAGVVVNDIGALTYLRGLNGFKPEISLGRIFAYNLRDFAPSSWFKKLFGRGVSSVEIDDRPEFDVYSRIEELKLNLHFPFRFVTYSRHCQITGKYNNNCRNKCRDNKIVEVLPNPLKQRVFLYGNALFCENRTAYSAKKGLPAILRSGRIGRIVYNSGIGNAGVSLR